MFKVLQHHRALARASEQQEDGIETPLRSPYQQIEAHPFRRPAFGDSPPKAKRLADLDTHTTVRAPSATNNPGSQMSANKEKTRDFGEDIGSHVFNKRRPAALSEGFLSRLATPLKIQPNVAQPTNGFSHHYLRRGTDR